MLPGLWAGAALPGALLLMGMAFGADINVPVTLQLGPNACSAFSYNVADKFSYEATLLGVVADQLCNKSDIMISKLYVQDACISLRDNQLGWSSYKAISCLSADDESTRTCNNVFNNAPLDSVLSVGNLPDGTVIDSGNVCANKKLGFFFVQSMCDVPVAVTFKVNVTDYKGKLCLAVAKRHFNGVAIAIIVVGSLLGVFLLALLVWCCCRCCCK